MAESGEQFLHRKDPKLHTTVPVEHEDVRRRIAREHEIAEKKSLGEESFQIPPVSQKPADKIANFLEVIKKTHMGHKDDPRVTERIKEFYYENYVIKPADIPESYFDNQRRLAREQGQGDIEITPEVRRQANETIISDQKSTLDTWLNYFTSSDSENIPMWAKYWSFTGMLKLATFDKQSHSFAVRDKTTVAPFPDLNREALAYVVDHMVKKYGKEYLDRQDEITKTQRKIEQIERYEQQAKVIKTGIDAKGRQVKPAVLEQLRNNLEEAPTPEQRASLQEEMVTLKQQQEKLLGIDGLPGEDRDVLATEEFGKLYAFAIDKITPTEENELLSTNGVWAKYSQGSDHMPLVRSLQGHGTGWCTAGESTAQTHLQGGDFYVFYSYGRNDKPNKPSIPRVAIRMQGNSIAEVRGIADQQNLDPYMGEVVEKKLTEFPDGQTYKKKVSDMRKLTAIEKKVQMKQNLDATELVFLYEVDSTIEGFGYKKDPRIAELRSQRNPLEDMPIVFGCAPDQIAQSISEIKPGTKAYVGPLEKGIFNILENAGVEHVYTSFPEGKIRRQKLEIGGKSKQQLVAEMKQQGINIYEYAQQMIDSPDFTTLPRKDDVDLVRLKVQDLGLGDDYPTINQIYVRASELGLKLCPPEVGLQLRLKDTNQPLGEWYYIGMKQIADRDGRPLVFKLGRDEDGLWLGDRWADPVDRWPPEFEFVFALRKETETQNSQKLGLLDKLFKR